MLALIAIDLDRFKAVNDSLGHGAGDKALKLAGQRLKECIRETDLVCRLGGDEFAVLQGRISSPEDGSVLADRIVRAMSRPFEIDGHPILLGASVGIAVAPVDGVDAEALMRRADLALYRAKAQGRGCYHYEQSLDEALQERRTLEAALRAAIWNDELRLFFQPLVSLSSNRVACMEALLRWQHPTRGLLDPGAFIGLAEETGLIVPVGRWVLRQACAAAAGWRADVAVSVNLSPAQLRTDSALIEHVRTALHASRLGADRLQLEIAESVLLADSEETLPTLQRLQSLGVKITVDRFGAGCSSLGQLRRFPFDKIKIDRTFVQDAPATDESRAILKAVIGLGRSLGMATTAEGVETEAQLEAMRQEGCTEAQGFFLGPPLPLNAVHDLLSVGGGPARLVGAPRTAGGLQ
jgi:diguanylate cyclase (GGDEF)-like protein